MVKYCQECGNASYDNAAICGNCGAKLLPKSEANAKPPSLDEKSMKSSKPTTSIFGETITKTDSKKTSSEKTSKSTFADKLDGFSNKLGQMLENFDSKSETSEEDKKRAEEEKVISRQTSSKPSFSRTATTGFKQKDKGTKNPAKKFDFPKKEVETVDTSKKEVKISTKKETKKETKRSTEKKETKIKKPNIETSELQKPETGSGFKNLNFKSIAIIVIIALIIIAIAGIGIREIQNQPTDKIEHYSNGPMSFNYSGNWSVYNNNNDDSNSSDIAFKTKDNTLIGYTTIQSDDISYELIEEDINATANSLHGSIIQSSNITIGNQNITGTEYILNTVDQGYSRYICILDNGVYYSFIINNGKSSNKNISALNTTEIQNMINSINLSDYNDNTTLNQEYY